MSYFAVIREAGPGWIEGKGAFEQPGSNEHFAFVNRLAEQGVVLFAGALAGSEQGRIRGLLIVEAASEVEIQNRLREDPWAVTKRVVTVSIEPWKLFIGEQRISFRTNPPIFEANPNRMLPFEPE